MSDFTINRRNFLKSIGIVGGGAMVACNTMAPEELLTAYLTPPVEMIPGVAAYYATICRACPAGCGVVARTREARPVKLEGNPAHPINRGKLCARGQASIQNLYGRNRVRRPQLRRDEALADVEWSAALDEVAAKLAAARSIGIITNVQSGSFEDLMSDLGRAFSKLTHVQHEPAVPTSLATAAGVLFGQRELPRIQLGSTSHLVSLGADFLDAWVSPVELARQWAARHGMAADRVLEMDYVGPRRNLTAIAADRFYSTDPAGVERLALALLHEVFAKRRARLAPGELSAVEDVLRQLGPRPDDAGIPDAALARMVERLTSTDKGLVLFGGSEVASERATATHTASLATNFLLGAVGDAIRFGEDYALGKADSDALALELVDAAATGALDVLLIHGANPALTLPGVVEKLSRAKAVVALAHEYDETARVAGAVLPVHHPLESWGDYQVTRDIAGLMQPVRAPLHDTKHVGDLLIELARRAGRKLPHSKYKDYLVARWTAAFGRGVPPATAEPLADAGPASLPAGATQGSPSTMSMDPGAWEQMLVAGGMFEGAGRGSAPRLFPAGLARLPKLNKVSPKPPAKADSPSSSAKLIIPTSNMLYDGRHSTDDWLREVPCPTTQIAWDIPAELSQDVAQAAGVKEGDLIEISSDAGKLTVAAIIESGLAPGTVALPPGGGRTDLKHGEGTANPYALLDARTDALSGELARAGVQVKISRVKSGSVVCAMGSPRSEGRLLALSMPLSDVRAGRYPVLTRHGQSSAEEAEKHAAHPVSMPHQEEGGTRPADNAYMLQEHAEHRWGLVIDLDLCIGCSACAVACYAENNIPVVGREEVGLGRELSWIRIEPHLFGEGKNERVQWLPVMCQQCDNAPCESVCPVFAASHTTDGLNAQIYNRCIGTRYCANNCPYKVRRFNYFDYEREKPGNQQLNPDVTVRSRGVMEKCTFCIQRIREVQNRRKARGAELKDGDIMPACAQTCPTGAISFGDFKQKDWKMSQLARDPRGYRLLDYMVNTRPGVVYLRRVLTDDEDQG